MIIYNTYMLLENEKENYVYIAETNKIFKINFLIKDVLLNKPATEEEMWKRVNRYDIKVDIQEMIDKLEEMKLIYERGDRIRKIEIEKLDICDMTLLVTQKCNLRCEYCFGDGGEYKNIGIMSFEVAKRAIDFLYEHSRNTKDIVILFFGGEPLINFEVIKRSVGYCKEKDILYNKKTHYSITTNGTITDDEIVQFLRENNFLVQVSIDGIESVTNANRFDIHRRGAYSRILEGAKALQDKMVVGARGTITPAGLNVSENVTHLLEEGFAYVHFAPANNMLKENDFEKIIENYFLYCEEFEKLLLEHKYKECIARHNLYSILREIHEGKKRNVYCAAGFKAISIDIDGYIYPCHRFVGDKEFCMGDVSTNVFEHDVIYNQLYKIPEKCKYCICQSICSGGCMHDNLLLMKNINIPAECNCKLQKFLTEQALKIYISLTDIDKKYLFGEESCYGG